MCTEMESKMINQMNAEQLREMFLFVAQRIVDSEEYLTEIDLKIGDGDHGIGMSVGFRGVIKELPRIEKFASAENVFKELGTILLDTMGGASGVLFGTMFISGIVKREEHDTIDMKGFAEIFRTSLNALQERGKAKIGDKTMVDAFEPAVIAMEDAAAKALSIKDGLRLAAKSAKEGMEYTKEVKARFGRAKYYGEKAIGLQDAGATSVWIIYQAMSDWADEHL